jgi:hypothetical protein
MDYDYHGILGQMLQYRELELIFQTSSHIEANIALVAELPFPTPLARGDARA